MRTNCATEPPEVRSGIYFNSKSCRVMIAASTRSEAILHKLKYRWRETGTWETKLKVAWCLIVLATALSLVA